MKKLRSIRRGDHGPDVKAVQEGFNKYYQAKVLQTDSAFGGETERVVKQFQRERGLVASDGTPDGVVGPVTRSVLFPLIGVTVNFWGIRTSTTTAQANSRFGTSGTMMPPLRLGAQPPLAPPALPTPKTGPSTLALPSVSGVPATDMIQPAGLTEAVPVPKVATPPGGRIVVEWQQLSQTAMQFDKLFTNRQDSFAVGFQSVFKRQQAKPEKHHLEIATGLLLQSPIGFQDGQKNDFTLAAFVQATWVEPLGGSDNYAWAPYVQVQGQGNATGPANVTGSLSLFPLDFNIGLGEDFNDVTLQLGAGAIGSLKFTPQGVKTMWGPQVGVGLSGKIWFLGQ